MSEIINSIYEAISSHRLPLHNEKATQQRIGEILSEANIPFKREHKLGAKDIPDFMVEDIAIEVKIKGSRIDIYKQCMRYLKKEQVRGLVLITGKSIGDFSKHIPEGKLLKMINISKSWL